MIWKIAVGVPTMFFAAIGGLWVADREPPTTVFSVQALTSEVRPGDQMRALYSVRRFRSCAVHVDRLLFDSAGERYVLEDIEFAAAPGPLGDASYTVGINIPRRFAEGPARYQAITQYTCNPFHKLSPIVVTGTPVSFDVKGPPLPADQSPIEIMPRR